MPTFLSDTIVAPESLSMFSSKMLLAKHTTRMPEQYFGQHGGVNRGTTISVPKPTFSEVRTGWNADWKGNDEDTVPVTFGEPIGVDKILEPYEVSMELGSEAGQRMLAGIMEALAAKVDGMVHERARQTPNFVGAPGTNPSALSTYLSGVARIRDFCAPDEDNMVVYSPQMEVDAVDFLKGLYQADDELKRQYKDGKVYRAAGLKWGSSQNTRTHVTGSNAGGALVKGASQTGASVLLDDLTASQTGVFRQNDVVQFPGCYAAHPVTKENLGFLMPFRVTVDANSDGSNETTVYIEPSIITSGPRQNVTASPDDDGAVLLFGHVSSYASKTARQGIIANKNAIALIFAPMDNPTLNLTDGAGVRPKTFTDKKLGLSISYMVQQDINTRKWKLRWDVWPATALLRWEWVCRVQSGS